MKNFNQTQSSNYLMYLDGNSLHGWAISQNLPENDFTFIVIPVNIIINLDYYLQINDYVLSKINKENFEPLTKLI